MSQSSSKTIEEILKKHFKWNYSTGQRGSEQEKHYYIGDLKAATQELSEFIESERKALK